MSSTHTGQEHEVCGVPGKLFRDDEPQEVRKRLVLRNQNWVSKPRPLSGYGKAAQIYVKLRFDDAMGNGHQTFSITAAVTTPASLRRGDIEAGGIMEDEIRESFPELEPLLKWHLFSTDGPLHYIANTLYHAGDRDHTGLRAGEPSSFADVVYFGDSKVSHKLDKKFAEFIKSRMREGEDGRYTVDEAMGEFRVVALAYEEKDYLFDDKYTFVGFGEKWYECPFDDEATAQEWAKALNTGSCVFKQIPVSYSKGKERDLDAARRSACWPEATDEQLMAEPEELRKALEARLPGLVEEFRADMERIGFKWEPEPVPGPKM